LRKRGGKKSHLTQSSLPLRREGRNRERGEGERGVAFPFGNPREGRRRGGVKPQEKEKEGRTIVRPRASHRRRRSAEGRRKKREKRRKIAFI